MTPEEEERKLRVLSDQILLESKVWTLIKILLKIGVAWASWDYTKFPGKFIGEAKIRWIRKSKTIIAT